MASIVDLSGNTLKAAGFVNEAGTSVTATAANSKIAAAAAVAAITVTPTSGSLPTANGAVTIANTATPTVVELLEYCTELNAKINAIRAALA